MVTLSSIDRLSNKSAQQSVHPTCGSLRDLGAFFWLWVFSTSQAESTPAHLRVTQTVRPHVFFVGAKTKWLVNVSSLSRSQAGSPSICLFGAVVFWLGFWVYRFCFFVGLPCLSAGFAHWQAWSSSSLLWLLLLWLWCLARNRFIISAGFFAVLPCQRCLEPRPKSIFLVC